MLRVEQHRSGDVIFLRVLANLIDGRTRIGFNHEELHAMYRKVLVHLVEFRYVRIGNWTVANDKYHDNRLHRRLSEWTVRPPLNIHDRRPRRYFRPNHTARVVLASGNLN